MISKQIAVDSSIYSWQSETPMKTENLAPRIETILEREFEIGDNTPKVTGFASPAALAWVLSQSQSKKFNALPHLVVVDSLSDAQRFQSSVHTFDPTCQTHILPPFDVSPYSGLYCAPHVLFERANFLDRALQAKPGQIFVTTLEALLQTTLPPDDFELHSHTWKVGADLSSSWQQDLLTFGYAAAPYVEDKGQFVIRGGLIDIWSPSTENPVRIELFGDQIESMRFFDPQTQQSLEKINSFRVIPTRESIYPEEYYESFIHNVRSSLSSRNIHGIDAEEVLRACVQKSYFPGFEFLLPLMYSTKKIAIDYFKSPLTIWYLDQESVLKTWENTYQELRDGEALNSKNPIHCSLSSLYSKYDPKCFPEGGRQVSLSLLEMPQSDQERPPIDYRIAPIKDFSGALQAAAFGSDTWRDLVKARLQKWRKDGYAIFVSTRRGPGAERLAQALEDLNFVVQFPENQDLLWDSWKLEQNKNEKTIHFFHGQLFESWRSEEDHLIFLQESDFFKNRERASRSTSSEDFQSRARRLSFGDLKPGDLVVHIKHGIGQYEGLKVMDIGGVPNEFIQLSYKDKDKLYLPVYRVGQLQKYSGASAAITLDRLGGNSWEKTKSKVKNHLRDIASELLQLYAKRSEAHRPPIQMDASAIAAFENSFPYEETEDQLRAINDIQKDLLSTKPMDRLICGDVGFGKTEVAMRAAFLAYQNNQQVAVLAPTTVLTFQHFETFKKRFQGWPIEIRVLNRFVSTAETKKTIAEAKAGNVQILIGTHKLFGKEIGFKNLGLLIIDEEQKFGVAHKEKIKKVKSQVDTVSLSATPIPRTLNMSLVGVRDLSLINSAPVDRLPTRTFICKWDAELIRKSITSEIARGGQVYFIHNRIQSIYEVCDDLRRIVPEARIRIGHGQMPEDELENTMLAFFNHEIDVLVCTAIVESGMDVSRANTMFIDRADLFGLSQLYQLRGRVGRSKMRAYCYLVLPKNKKLDAVAQERLRVIQENTALGSGIRIAQYDLELRGSGTILGEEQSGHVDSVGYELYMDLLKESLAEAQGKEIEDSDLDPEINLRIPALIPDQYISDVRIRLSYYKALAEVKSEQDIERISNEMEDQFGKVPDPTINLMGLMLIRKVCKELGIRDVSSGVKTISLIFTEKTPVKPEYVIKLAMKENKKYSITPDNRLNIRMNNMTWMAVLEELNLIMKSI